MAKKYKNELSAFDMAGTVFENGVNATETNKGRTTKKEKTVRSDKMKVRELLSVQLAVASRAIPVTPTSYPSR